MMRGVTGCGFNFVGVACTLDLVVPEAISKKLEPMYALVLYHRTKLQAMDLAETPSKEVAARQFKVDPKRTREWCQQKHSLVDMNKRRGFM